VLRLALLALCWLVLPVPAWAQEPWLRIVAPEPGAFAIGETLLEARLEPDEGTAPEVRQLSFFVDQRLVATLTSPPFSQTVDLGPGTDPHLIEARAVLADGRELEAMLETLPVPVGGEVAVELQQLYVSVTEDGEAVPDLRPEEVTVVDDGLPQRIISFSQGKVPFTAVLLIDASQSMQGAKLEAACAGARAFVEGMAALDQARVMVFSDRLLASSPLTGDPQVLSLELSRARAAGGTALNDYLFAALKLLEQRQGRRVVVLLSDGIDTHSALTMQQVLTKVHQSQALVYWIRLNRLFGRSTHDDGAPSLTSTWRDSAEYREQWDLLFEAVESSGGFVTRVDSTGEITPVFERILADLRDQYAIGYYPTTEHNDGRWHPVQIRIRRFGLDVRTQQGYVDL
jgi:VWFA-related protein